MPKYTRRLGQAISRAPPVLRKIGETANRIDSSKFGAVVRSNPYTSTALSLAKQGGRVADFIEKTSDTVKEGKSIADNVKQTLEAGGNNDLNEATRSKLKRVRNRV